MAVAYWLVNTGTREDPPREDLRALYQRWDELQGPFQKFPQSHRPSQMRPGDILIHRAVRSPDRIVAVAEVLSTPHPTRGDQRWSWQVERRLLHVCHGLSSAPRLADIGEERARGLRVFKRLPRSHGERAHNLIAAAGFPWGEGR